MISNMMFQSVILVIQQANLLAPVHILKPYTFQSEFCAVVHYLVMFLNCLIQQQNLKNVSGPNFFDSKLEYFLALQVY